MNDGLCVNGPNKNNYVESDCDYIRWADEPAPATRLCTEGARPNNATYKTVTYIKKWRAEHGAGRWYTWEC